MLPLHFFVCTNVGTNRIKRRFGADNVVIRFMLPELTQGKRGRLLTFDISWFCPDAKKAVEEEEKQCVLDVVMPELQTCTGNYARG